MVLGMARSGTSAITKALAMLGISLGNELVPAQNKWNATGFWEDEDILYKIHGKIFNALHFKAYGFLSLTAEEQLSAGIKPIRAEAIALLQQRFATTAHFAFKDPSTVKLLVFWASIYQELGLQPHYIIALRHPLAVAKSYSLRTGVDAEASLLLWIMSLVETIDHIILTKQYKNTVIVSYELLMQEPMAELNRLATAMNLSVPEQTGDFFNKDLQHFTSEAMSGADQELLLTMPLCRKIYSLLLLVANDDCALDSQYFKENWHDIKHELAAVYPLYLYLDKILRKNYELQQSHRAIRKSFLWKLLAPLWRFDLSMRAKRKLRYLKKRINKAYG